MTRAEFISAWKASGNDGRQCFYGLFFCETVVGVKIPSDDSFSGTGEPDFKWMEGMLRDFYCQLGQIKNQWTSKTLNNKLRKIIKEAQEKKYAA